MTTHTVEPTGVADAEPSPVTTSAIRRRWSSSVFSLVAEGQERRRPSDIVRMVVAAILVALAAAGATDVTSIEAGFANLFASLPGGLEGFWDIVNGLALVVAGGLLVLALVTRRWHLLATQIVAIGVAWLAASALSSEVDAPAGAVALGGGPSDFPVALLAAGAAGLMAARPYVTRPAGRSLLAVVWLSALAVRVPGRRPAGRGRRQLGRGVGRLGPCPPLLRLPRREPLPRPGRGIPPRPRRRPDRAAPRAGAELGLDALPRRRSR